MVDGVFLRGQFSYNLEANVGLNSPNKIEDVQFVQFGYCCKLRNPLGAAELTAAERSAYADIKIGPPCTGREDDPLVKAIRVHEQVRGGTQDGWVSRYPPGTPVVYDRQHHTFIVFSLVINMIETHHDIWPRIDMTKMIDLPSQLSTQVRKMFHIK